jgi:hypothetical protein
MADTQQADARTVTPPAPLPDPATPYLVLDNFLGTATRGDVAIAETLGILLADVPAVLAAGSMRVATEAEVKVGHVAPAAVTPRRVTDDPVPAPVATDGTPPVAADGVGAAASESEPEVK